ncbi:MAG: DUF502 domain-containing protein [Myxococcales bacterium]|nr:DUF502 domain-containing protein [Myxococcales bacterium]
MSDRAPTPMTTPTRTGVPTMRLLRPETPTRRALRHLRDRMLAGIAVVAPVWVTVVSVVFLFRLARGGSLWVISALLSSSLGAPLLSLLGTSEQAWQAGGMDALPVHGEWLVSFVAIALTLATVYGAGLVSMFVLGRRAIGLLESLVSRVPLVATVYGASKKVVDSFTNDENQPFQEVVLVEFPTPASRSVAFVTRRWRAGDQEWATVFVPTTPNPTSGFMLVLSPEHMQVLPMSVDEAVAVVMSGGVLMKDGQRVPGLGER